jgi:hypothetical protein
MFIIHTYVITNTPFRFYNSGMEYLLQEILQKIQKSAFLSG